MCVECFYRTVFDEGSGEGRVVGGCLHVLFEVAEHVLVEAEKTLDIRKEGEHLLLVEAVRETLLEGDHLPKRAHVGLLRRDHLPVDPPAADAVLLALLRGVLVLGHNLVDVRALPGLGLVLGDRVPAHLACVLLHWVFHVL